MVAGFRESKVRRVPAQDNQPLKGKTQALKERCYPLVPHGSLVTLFEHFPQVPLKDKLTILGYEITMKTISSDTLYPTV